VALYISCFKDGLDIPALTQDAAWFGAVFVKMLIAQQAFIDDLQSKLIQVENAVFGGPRFEKNSQGQLFDKGENLRGFALESSGKLKVSEGEFRRGNFEDITMTGGTSSDLIANNLEANDATIKNMNVEGNLNANVSLFGSKKMKLYGGVRDYLSFFYINNNITEIKSSNKEIDIFRDSQGKYTINFNGSYPYDVLETLAVLASAWNENADVGYNVLKRWGGWNVNISQGHIVARVLIDIRTPSGTLTDPYFCSLLFIG